MKTHNFLPLRQGIKIMKSDCIIPCSSIHLVISDNAPIQTKSRATNQAGVEKKLVLLRRPSVRLCWRLSPGTKRAFKEGKLKATLAEPECIAEVKSSTSLEESSLPPSHPLSLFSSSLSLPLFSSFSLPPFHSFPLLLVLSPSFSSCLLLSLLTFRLIRLPPSQTSHPPHAPT